MKKKAEEKKSDPLAPATDVLIKLGSLAVHVEELIECAGGFEEFEGTLLLLSDAIPFDVAAIRTILEDESFKAWRAEMSRLALLPVKRK